MSGASRVTVSRAQQTRAQLNARPPTVVGVVGVTERGPIGERHMVDSWAEYQRVYGGFTPNSDAALFAYLAFQEAGETGSLLLEFSRVVHCTTAADPTTKTSAKGTLTLATDTVAESAGSVLGANVGPFNLEPGDTLVLSVNGGGNATATFSATAAARTAGNTGPYVMTNGMTLTVSVDGGSAQTITFLTAEFVDIGAATATEVAAVIAAKIVGAQADVNSNAPRIRSDRRGTGSGVNVTGGTANAVLGFTTGNIAGGGNVSNIDAVTVSEVETIVEAAVAGCSVTNVGGAAQIATNTLGAGGSIQVVASSTADDELGLDNAVHAGAAAGDQDTLRVDGKWDGTYANALSVRIAAASNGASDEFNIEVLRGGIVVERWINCSMDADAPNYVVRLVNEGGGTQLASNLITLVDLESTLDSPDNLPLAGTFGPLTGGNDGLVGLVDADFVGGESVNGKTGIRVLDSATSMTMLVVPGRATSAVHNAMITYCEVTRGGTCYAVLDPPANNNATQIRTYVTSTAALKGLSEFASIYWPRILADNPDTGVYGLDKTITVAPSGSVVGMMARVDASKIGGAFEHPAGKLLGTLRTARGLEGEADGVERNDVRDLPKRGLVFDDLINPIMAERGSPMYVDGARTLKATGPFPTVGESRGVVFVSKQFEVGLDIFRNANIRPALLNSIRTDIDEFLRLLTDAKCFASEAYDEAFYVDVGKGLNTPAIAEARRVRGRIGIATAKPAEFIDIEIGSFAVQA